MKVPEASCCPRVLSSQIKESPFNEKMMGWERGDPDYRTNTTVLRFTAFSKGQGQKNQFKETIYEKGWLEESCSSQAIQKTGCKVDNC